MERKEKKKDILFLIDPQNDFVDPENGKLYINGAEKAIKELCKWIGSNRENLARIIITQDSHMSYHIGHGAFWKEYPSQGTIITYEDVIYGKYNPSVPLSEYGEEINEDILDYFQILKEKGLVHRIWPEHCIKGSWGWCFPDSLVEAINLWSLKNNGLVYDIIEKGTYPYKEMYSAISYADGMVDEDIHDFLLDTFIINEGSMGKIYIAGFAKDYCVAETVKDLIKMPITKDRLVFLEGCMATIDENNSSLKIYEKAVENYGACSY